MRVTRSWEERSAFPFAGLWARAKAAGGSSSGGGGRCGGGGGGGGAGKGEQLLCAALLRLHLDARDSKKSLVQVSRRREVLRTEGLDRGFSTYEA